MRDQASSQPSAPFETAALDGEPTPSSQQRWRDLVVCLALTAAVVGVYAGRLAGPFVFDDEQAIVENATLRSLDPSQVFSPPRETPVAARPVVNLSFALDRALFGLSPLAFHVTNLCIHVLCTALVYLILLELLATARQPAHVRQHAAGYAFVTALCFGVHPLATEIVLYTSQRSEGLVALFYLATCHALVRDAADPGSQARRWPWVMLLGLLGAGSKEVFASALLVTLGLDRAFFAGSFKAALHARRRFYLALSVSWLPLILLQLNNPRPDSVRLFELDYLLAQTTIVPHYIALAFWPHDLAFDYGPLWPNSMAPRLPWIVASAVVVAALIVCAVRYPRLGFLAVWILAILAPSSSLFSIHTEVGAERRFYLPLAAVLAYSVVAIGALARRSWQPRPGWGLACAAAAALALGLQTRARAADFRSVRSVWESAVRARPRNARAHYNLAETYRREADLAAAIAAFQTALRMHEAYPDAHGNLAGALLAKGDITSALSHLQRARQLAPDNLTTRLNYAIALGLTGDTRAAVRELREVLRRRPEDLEAHRQLVVGLALLGQADEARQHAHWVLEHSGQDATALRALRDVH